MGCIGQLLICFSSSGHVGLLLLLTRALAYRVVPQTNHIGGGGQPSPQMWRWRLAKVALINKNKRSATMGLINKNKRLSKMARINSCSLDSSVTCLSKHPGYEWPPLSGIHHKTMKAGCMTMSVLLQRQSKSGHQPQGSICCACKHSCIHVVMERWLLKASCGV
ncbi:hypothetical protein ABBQ38_005524 [Trebouxia sp. C0009 RCD-2024]